MTILDDAVEKLAITLNDGNVAEELRGLGQQIRQVVEKQVAVEEQDRDPVEKMKEEVREKLGAAHNQALREMDTAIGTQELFGKLASAASVSACRCTRCFPPALRRLYIAASCCTLHAGTGMHI